VPWINLLLIVVALYVIYRISTNKKFVKKLTGILRTKILKKEIFKPVSFEELLLLAGGYGVSKIDVSVDNPLVDKTLADSELRKSDITVLAIVRANVTIPNPPANTKILAGDELVSFGKLENIRSRCVPKREKPT
jgi:ribosomal protein S6--L-glutamate ligase